MVTRRVLIVVGLAAGMGLCWGALEAPYYNRQRFVAPVDEQPLRIRQDAKGDGRYQAPRSGNRRHRGIDLAAPLGSPVRAVRSGRVIHVGMDRGLGRFVQLEHRGGLRSLYAHLDTAPVRAGQRVRQGAVIGTIGKTGNAKHPWIEPHVHFELAQAGEAIDPGIMGLTTMASPAAEMVDGRGGE